MSCQYLSSLLSRQIIPCDLSDGFLLLQILSIIDSKSVDLGYYASKQTLKSDALQTRIWSDVQSAIQKLNIPFKETKSVREGQIEACEELVRVLTELGSDIEEGEDEMEFDDLEFSTPLACLIKWCFAFAGDREGIHALERDQMRYVVTNLTSGKLYQASATKIFPGSSAAFLDVLIEKKFLNIQASLKDSVLEMVRDYEPFYDSIHMNIMEALCWASRRENLDEVVDEIRSFVAQDGDILHPYDVEDGLMIWVNQALRSAGKTWDMDELIKDFGISNFEALVVLMRHYFPEAGIEDLEDALKQLRLVMDVPFSIEELRECLEVNSKQLVLTFIWETFTACRQHRLLQLKHTRKMRISKRRLKELPVEVCCIENSINAIVSVVEEDIQEILPQISPALEAEFPKAPNVPIEKVEEIFEGTIEADNDSIEAIIEVLADIDAPVLVEEIFEGDVEAENDSVDAIVEFHADDDAPVLKDDLSTALAEQANHLGLNVDLQDDEQEMELQSFAVYHSIAPDEEDEDEDEDALGEINGRIDKVNEEEDIEEDFEMCEDKVESIVDEEIDYGSGAGKWKPVVFMKNEGDDIVGDESDGNIKEVDNIAIDEEQFDNDKANVLTQDEVEVEGGQEEAEEEETLAAVDIIKLEDDIPIDLEEKNAANEEKLVGVGEQEEVDIERTEEVVNMNMEDEIMEEENLEEEVVSQFLVGDALSIPDNRREDDKDSPSESYRHAEPHKEKKEESGRNQEVEVESEGVVVNTLVEEENVKEGEGEEARLSNTALPTLNVQNQGYVQFELPFDDDENGRGEEEELSEKNEGDTEDEREANDVIIMEPRTYDNYSDQDSIDSDGYADELPCILPAYEDNEDEEIGEGEGETESIRELYSQHSPTSFIRHSTFPPEQNADTDDISDGDDEDRDAGSPVLPYTVRDNVISYSLSGALAKEEREKKRHREQMMQDSKVGSMVEVEKTQVKEPVVQVKGFITIGADDESEERKRQESMRKFFERKQAQEEKRRQDREKAHKELLGPKAEKGGKSSDVTVVSPKTEQVIASLSQEDQEREGLRRQREDEQRAKLEEKSRQRAAAALQSSSQKSPRASIPIPRTKPKSNKQLVKNALNVLLAGAVNTNVRKEVLEDMADSKSDNFIILLRDSKNHSFRGLYSYDVDLGQVLKLWSGGLGPNSIAEHDVVEFFKYDTGSRSFKGTSMRQFSSNICAVAMPSAYMRKI